MALGFSYNCLYYVVDRKCQLEQFISVLPLRNVPMYSVDGESGEECCGSIPMGECYEQSHLELETEIVGRVFFSHCSHVL